MSGSFGVEAPWPLGGRHLRGQGHGFGAQETIRCRFGIIMGQVGDGATGAVGAALGAVP